MIDEHRYRMQRARLWRALFSDVRVALVTVTAVGLFVLQAITLYLAATGHQ